MIKTATGTILALLVGCGVAFAQTTPPAAPTDTTAVETKFKAADKNGNGELDGAELDEFKTNLTAIDTDKDGKISMDEFSAAVKAGHIE